MFTEYDREFDQKLDNVARTYEAFKNALKELYNDHHSLNESEVGTTDLTQVDYQVCDMDAFMVDEIGTLRKQQDELPGKYQTYDYRELANENRLSTADVGLKTGRQ